MAEQLIEVHLSPQKTFLVLCPHCNQSKILNLNDLPPNSPNPFNYECRCGGFSTFLFNYLMKYLEGVYLAGMLLVPSATKKILKECIFLFIFFTRTQDVTDLFKNICGGPALHLPL